MINKSQICAAKLTKSANYVSRVFFRKIDQKCARIDKLCQQLCQYNLSKPSFYGCIVSTALANCSRHNKEMNQYPLRVQQLAYCPYNMDPMRTHEGACLRLTIPQYDGVPTFTLFELAVLGF